MSLDKLIAVARGSIPADLLLTNAKVINTCNGEIEEGTIAVWHGRIAGVGDYDQGREVIDLGGMFVAPGIINGHTHIESSMLHIARYAEALVPRGVTGVVTDLHEIANVQGIAGVNYILSSAKNLPLNLYFMAPSCVPATNLETSGACLTVEELRLLLS